ncbi:hypothetical protein JMN32_12365 [Fulvivirga sp. 29W222]|uniref:Uncharacterized protein n=1 Tax=Fulvivirga marina TaxID=2494733 RepID=A0A937KC45_9BACT|nr:hypothetical protein [Fulvivirga marina]MBL6447107.1 hypothetical protein [Fulvivirga marina]
MIIKKIFEKGYQHAARSFSQLAGLEIKKGILAIELFNKANHSPYEMPFKQKFTILRTKIFGETNGESLLILSESERKFINSKSPIPASTSVSIDEPEFLLELDNIISASTITEISNSLNISIYGGVPDLLTNRGDDLNNYIHDGKYPILIKGYFDFEGFEEVKPTFIFRMSEEFLGVAKHIN